MIALALSSSGRNTHLVDRTSKDSAGADHASSGTERHGLSSSWLVWLCFGFVAYVLSTGPMAALDQGFDFPKKCPALERTLDVFYKPVVAVADSSHAAHMLFRWYLLIFGVDIGK